jgi:hypothetical protein
MAEEKKRSDALLNLNITVVALVALVAIVGLAAIVLNGSSGRAAGTAAAENSASQVMDQLAAEVRPVNAAGSAIGLKSCVEYRLIADTGHDSGGWGYGTRAITSAERLATWGGC